MFELLSRISDFVGIIGVCILLISYFLLSTNRISSTDIRYPLCNLIGSSLVLFSLLFTFNLASMVIECAWMLISLIGIYRIFKTQV
jgi:hypothetical protein